MKEKTKDRLTRIFAALIVVIFICVVFFSFLNSPFYKDNCARSGGTGDYVKADGEIFCKKVSVIEGELIERWVELNNE